MKKRITSLLLTLAMLLSLLPAMGVTASAAAGGDGTKEHPYVVTTYEELQTAMQKAGGGYVQLGKDIDTTELNDKNGIGRDNQIVVNSNVALDLNGCKVTLLKYNTVRSGLIDVRHGSLTIEDSKGGGELNGKNMTTGTRMYLIECYDGAKVTVNSGTLSMWSAQTAQTANAVILGEGTVEINGGTLAISNQKNYDEVDMYLAQQDCAVKMTTRGSAVINGGTFQGRVLLYAHAKSESKAGSVINGGDFKKSVYVQKDRAKTVDVPLDVSIRGGTYHYTPGYRTNDEGSQVSDPQDMFQFATLGFLEADRPYYDETPYPHGADPAEGKLGKYDLAAFRSIFPTNAILVAKGQSYTHRDYRDGSETEVQLVDKLFTGADNTEWARLMNSEYQTIDVVSDIQLEDATLKVGDTTVPDNGGNVTTGDKTITITGKVNKRIAQLVNSGKIDLGFVLNVVKTTKPMEYLHTTTATLSTASNSDGRLNVTVTLPSAQLVKADYSVRLDLFPKKPGTTTTPVGEGLLPSGWKLSADSANHPVTINYNANGGSGTMASQKVMSGKQPYTLPDCTFTAPAAGQVFKGWSTAQDGTDILSDGKLPLTDVESSVTMYAIWGAPTEMEIDKVTLSVKNYSQRQSTDDFRVVDKTPSKEMSYKGFWVREGLNNKDGDYAGTYDKTKNYSVVYEFEAALGYQFAENISVDDVSANDGEVWHVQLFNGNKTLQVCVNYRSGDSIKGMQLKVKEPLAGDSARDDAYAIRSTDGRYAVEYTDWYQGKFTDNSQLSGTPFTGTFAAGQQYTCAFRVKANDGYKVAPGYTAGLLLNGAQVTNCKELNPTGDDVGGYYGLYTFTVMDTSDDIIKGMRLKVKEPTAGASSVDAAYQISSTDSRYAVDYTDWYQGEITDNSYSGPKFTGNFEAGQKYTCAFRVKANAGYKVAHGYTGALYLNEAQVTKCTELVPTGDDAVGYLGLYTFTVMDTSDDIIKGMRLKVKEPTAGASSVDAAYQISSTDSRYAVDYTDWYQGEITDNSYSGPKFTGNFEAGQKYTCAFRVKANAGYKVAHGYTGALYLNEAQVTKCTELVPTGDDAVGYLGLYTFTAVDDPTPETKTIEKINLDFKPYSDRSKLDDLTPTYTPGTDMMKLSTKIFCEGDAITSTALDDNDAYDPTKSYTALFHFNFEDGVTIAKDFAQKDVSVSNGIIKEVRRNDTFTVIVVNFPKAPTTGPTTALTGTASITGTLKFGETLTASLTSTNNTGALSYQWKRDGADIAGATNSTYKLVEEDIGKTITVKITSSVQTGEITASTAMTIEKADGPAAPAAFTLTFALNSDGATYTATIPAITGGEYSFDGTTYSSANTKADCNPNTSYTGYARIAATTTHKAGTATSNTQTSPKLTVATPTFTPNGASSFTGTQSVTIKCATTGAKIYYTTDGTEPTASSTEYTTALSLTSTTTVKAIAVKTGMNNSAVATATFTKAPSGGGSSGGGGGGVTTYAITVQNSKNGAVTASHKSAAKDTAVTLTVTPDKGYVLDTLTVLDSKDKAVKLTEKNGKYTFTMPAGKVTVSAAFKAAAPASENPFTDVPSGAYYEDAVIWAVKKDITSGTTATTFDPDGSCTRAQAVTFLWRAAGSPEPKSAAMPFTDVPAGSYFEKAVLWAVENGITKGTSDTTFGSDASCTRAQIVTFLWRANGSHAVSGNSAFSDVAADAYYAAAVAWAEKNGVTGGIGGGLFGSDNTCTRAQIVTFLHRAMK